MNNSPVDVLPLLYSLDQCPRGNVVALETSLEVQTNFNYRASSVELLPPLTSADPVSMQLIRQSRIDEKIILSSLCLALSAVTSIHLTERAIKILLGHWLRRVIETSNNRLFKFESILAEQKRLNIHVITPPDHLTPSNSLDYLFLTNVSGFKYWFNQSVILNRIGTSDFNQPCTVVPSDKGSSLELSYPEVEFGTASQRRRAIEAIIHSSQKIVRQQTVLATPYIPLLPVLLSQLSQPAIPYLFLRSRPSKAIRDPEKRSALLSELRRSLGGRSLRGLEATVVDFLPTTYLEGLSCLFDKVKEAGLPKRPRSILAGNHFDTNEVFKAYVAQETSQGTKYLVNQHGNNYGVNRFSSPSVEEETADLFLTWGWSRDNPAAIPIGVGKNVWRRRIKRDVSGKLLVVRNSRPFAIGVVDAQQEFQESEGSELRFLMSLTPRIQRQTVIRPHSFSLHIPSGNEDINQQAQAMGMQFSTRPFLNELRHTRLAIFNYDSTGFLELINLDFPAIVFSPNGFHHVSDQWKELYDQLRSAKLAFSTAEEAANHINTIWDDVQAWWGSKILLEAKARLVMDLAQPPKSPVQTLRRLTGS